MPNVKQLLLAEGISVTPSPNTTAQAGSYVGFANDAAYVTAKGSAAANGDVYYNTTTAMVRLYAGGAWVNEINATGTQILTNKDIDGGTASDSRRITLPKGTLAALTALTRKAGTIVYATDTQKMYLDNGSSLLPLGGGGGISTVYLDHTDDGANLADGFRYIVFMKSATASIDLNAPAGASGVYFEVNVTGVEDQAAYATTPYYVDVLKNGSDTFWVDGKEYTTGVTLGEKSSYGTFGWDTGGPYWSVTSLGSYTGRTLAGVWDIDAIRFPSDGTSELDYYTEDSGSATWTANSSSATGAVTVFWTRVGDAVILTIPPFDVTSMTGSDVALTSNAVLPTGLKPSSETWLFGIVIKDNSSQLASPGVLRVNTDGTMVIYKDGTAATNWTAGTGGVAKQNNFSYKI